MVLEGRSGQQYRLQNAPFAGGGEGDIYDIIGLPGYVAKKYKKDERATERMRKLTTMVTKPPGMKDQCAWPTDILRENGKVVGYVMPKIIGKRKLKDVYEYSSRRGKKWSFYITIAKNLAAAVHNVHEINHVIGDLNHNNILVDPNNGMVTLVDTDSYHISNGKETYRCRVGMPIFVAPELQGVDFPSAPLPTFTKETDRFSLAVLIFRLLMNGAHPFACTVTGGSASRFQPIENIKDGKCAYFPETRGSNMKIPGVSPDMDALTLEIRQLFRRAFVTGHGRPVARPTAAEWHRALEQMESQLKTCGRNTSHVYYQGSAKCPWCEVERKMTSTQKTMATTNTTVTKNTNTSGGTTGYSNTGYPKRTLWDVLEDILDFLIDVFDILVEIIGVFWQWILGLIVVIVLAVFLFRGCGRTDDETDSPEIGNESAYTQDQDGTGEDPGGFGETPGDNKGTESGAEGKTAGKKVQSSAENPGGADDQTDPSGNGGGENAPEGGGADASGNRRRESRGRDVRMVAVKNTWLTELSYVKIGDITIRKGEGKANTGETYSHYLFSSSPFSEAVYNLNGKYDRLTALWAICSSDKDTDSRNNFDIYADNKLVYSSPTITGGSLPVKVDVDITGCNLLTILFKEGSGAAELGNIYLSNQEKLAVKKKPFQPGELSCWLTDLEHLKNNGVSVRSDSTQETNTGVEFSHYLYGDAGEEILYYLQGKYRYISGLWALSLNNRNTDAKNRFEIYADDELVYESPVMTGGSVPVTFTVDIKSCEKLRIVFTGGSGYAGIGNIRLSPDEESLMELSSLYSFSLTDTSDTWLTDLNYFVNHGVSIQSNSVDTANTGKSFSHYLYGDAKEEVVYYLGGKYGEISGLWLMPENYSKKTSPCSFEIYADERLIYMSPAIAGEDPPVEFQAELEGCEKLRIVFTGGSGYARVANIKLKAIREEP